jgi:hypothetical protein
MLFGLLIVLPITAVAWIFHRISRRKSKLGFEDLHLRVGVVIISLLLTAFFGDGNCNSSSDRAASMGAADPRASQHYCYHPGPLPDESTPAKPKLTAFFISENQDKKS